jgi:hypothetical protein
MYVFEIRNILVGAHNYLYCLNNNYVIYDNPTRKFLTNRIAAFFKFGPIKLIYSEKTPSRVKKQLAEWKNN